MSRFSVRNQSVESRLQICAFMLRGGWAYDGAKLLGALMEAEECGVISDAWRTHVSVLQAMDLIATRMSIVRRRWDGELLSLRRLLVSRTDLLRADATLILVLRSELEWGARFLPRAHHRRLSRLDGKLRAVLTRDGRVFQSARATNAADI